MRIKSTIIILILIRSITIAQVIDTLEKVEPFTIIDNMPYFMGKSADVGVKTYIDKHLIYPEYAYSRKISGRVFVTFTVDKSGKVKDVYIVRGIHPSIDYVAFVLIKNMPKWSTAPSRGKYQPVKFTIPVKFDMKKTGTQQISKRYDEKIEHLMSLDSLTLDSILYLKKPIIR